MFTQTVVLIGLIILLFYVTDRIYMYYQNRNQEWMLSLIAVAMLVLIWWGG